MILSIETMKNAIHEGQGSTLSGIIRELLLRPGDPHFIESCFDSPEIERKFRALSPSDQEVVVIRSLNVAKASGQVWSEETFYF